MARVHPETCPRCPNRYSKVGCPCWVSKSAGLLKMSPAGETAFIEGCYYEIMPWMMVEVIKASNRPAAAVESTRNEIVRGFQQLTFAVATHGPEAFKQLGHGEHSER